ncbi:MAG TPA: T9SS type A sorting domain-containing protein [Cytophagaceae bacterium]|jgi:plastocyanin|nr:T9SS type A sorting domain-containing protein [Cytophagaceae bacterium]
MKKSILIIALFFGVTASLSAQTTHNISITDFQFTPPTLTIAMGDKVMWTNNSSSTTHTATSGSGCPSGNGIWDSGNITPGTSYTSPAFNTAGSFPYHCIYHCGSPYFMTGTITVTGSTGIFNSKSSASSLNIFPNPFTDLVTLSIEQGKNNVSMIKVTDAVGKEMKNIEVSAGQSSYSIDLSDLQPGMYFCNLYSSDGIMETRKIFRAR